MWLNVRFLENLSRVSFVFDRCETTFQHINSIILHIINNKNVNLHKRASATHESSKLLQRCSNTISNINLLQQHKGHPLIPQSQHQISLHRQRRAKSIKCPKWVTIHSTKKVVRNSNLKTYIVLRIFSESTKHARMLIRST